MTELEKIAKNLFRMFRDSDISAEKFTVKFRQIKEKLDQRESVMLESEYHRELKSYIERLCADICGNDKNDKFDDERLSDIREAEMSNLNRLQKLKNASSYKKHKHKQQAQNEDWG
jgi:hypothetical protein